MTQLDGMPETEGLTLSLGEALWAGETEPEEFFKTLPHALVEVSHGVGFVASSGNVVVLKSMVGLILVDTSGPMSSPHVIEQVRSWSGEPITHVVLTHGHLDHVSGLRLLDEDAVELGQDPPVVVAHRSMPSRFDRYSRTAGWNTTINERQFHPVKFQWPTTYRAPDVLFDEEHDLEVGGLVLRLHHARGETGDATWVHLPEERIVCTGDLFIWVCPNAGNPQKPQRYALEWAHALRRIAVTSPVLLLPGHGPPIQGKDRIQDALLSTARLLERLDSDVVAMMNEGKRLDEIISCVRAPVEFLEKPFLKPIYDDPEFIVRNIWRLYGGWWDGNPSTLLPAPDSIVAEEVATLAGGVDRLVERSRTLADEENLRLAGHLIEMASLAAPTNAMVLEAHAAIYEMRANAEPSSMARAIFQDAARRSRAALAGIQM